MRLRKRFKTSLFTLVCIAVLGLAVVFIFGPRYIDKQSNVVVAVNLPKVSADTAAFHQTLTIADMHEDILLWNRALLERHDHGHTDVPRLIEGNVSLQIFAAVTKSPKDLNYKSNPSDSDMITPLVMFQRWPVRTWFSLKERALYQAQKLHTAAAESQGKLSVVTSAADLSDYLASRGAGAQTMSGLLAIEGLHAIEGDLANLDDLFNAGYRMMGLTHFFDNKVAGSAHGLQKGGLTDLGKQVLARMEQLGIVVDLAHLSPTAISEVLATVTKPVVVSHTGVQGTCPGVRNLTDDQLLKIAHNGGVVGLGYWDGAICDVSPKSFAKAARYVADLVGVEHIGLGSDFDGYVTTGFDTAQLQYITQALVDAGFTRSEIRLIMGGNTVRLLKAVLP